jgi:hypothetical protein
METQISEIATLNDAFRTANPLRFMITRGVAALGHTDKILAMVREFANFNESNDPHGEHDFGAFQYLEEIFWKIDYYTPELSGWCDPLDPNCNRVLTVMLAEEY